MNQQRELAGILFRNDRKSSPKHPDYKGSATIGGTEYYLSGWIKEGRTGKFLSLAFKAKDDQREAPARDEDDIPSGTEGEDDIPF